MRIILGSTGHIGTHLSQKLLDLQEPVMMVTHDSSKAENLKRMGADVAVVDVLDTDALHEVFKKGKKLFLLNPPADPSTDTAAEERRTLTSILKAIEGSGLEKIVAESTYGAQPGELLGDLAVLYEMEEGLKKLNIPHSIIRAAYYYSNWNFSAVSAKGEGKIYSFFPANFKLPMVAPHDIAQLAAKLLIEPVNAVGLYYCTGPEDYSPSDVASAFSETLDKPVEVVAIPQDQWVPQLQELGFSEKAAISMAHMTAVTLEKKYEVTAVPQRGTTTIKDYVKQLVEKV